MSPEAYNALKAALRAIELSSIMKFGCAIAQASEEFHAGKSLVSRFAQKGKLWILQKLNPAPPPPVEEDDEPWWKRVKDDGNPWAKLEY